MEQYVESLFKRLNDDEKPELLAIMNNAINELHNNGIFDKLPLETLKLIHDPDPDIRLAEKTSLAKSIGRSFVLESRPLVTADNEISHLITVEFNPEFMYSICLCIQGGLEGLFLTGIYKQNKSGVFKYTIRVKNYNEITDEFKSNIDILNKMYENFCLEIVSGEYMQEQPKTKKPT